MLHQPIQKIEGLLPHTPCANGEGKSYTTKVNNKRITGITNAGSRPVLAFPVRTANILMLD